MSMKIVGILGGGQFVCMMVLVGVLLGLCFELFDLVVDVCGVQVVLLQVVVFEDEVVLVVFVVWVDVVMFDFENVFVYSVCFLVECVLVYLNLDVLVVVQDWFSEKILFQQLGILLLLFVDICSCDELVVRVVEFGMFCIVKMCCLGYDGKGQFCICSIVDIDVVWVILGDYVDCIGLILEGFVVFDCEVSVVVVCGCDGEFCVWLVIGNWYVDGVLLVSLVLVWLSQVQYEVVIGYVWVLVECLDYVGVFVLELFCCGDELLVNEMVLCVYNFGYWIIEGSEILQFENYLCVVFGLLLGDMCMLGYVCMFNWLGVMFDVVVVLVQFGGYWYDYGKQLCDGCKVGYVMLCDDDVLWLVGMLQMVGGLFDCNVQVVLVIDVLCG